MPLILLFFVSYFIIISISNFLDTIVPLINAIPMSSDSLESNYLDVQNEVL